MLLDWFNAHEASEVGAKLADRFLPKFTLGADESGSRDRSVGMRAEKLLHEAARQVTPLKLNFFKRTKLLASLKWRLLEHGFDHGTVDELIQGLLLQITTGVGSGIAVAAGGGTQRPPRQAKHLSALLADARARSAEGKYEAAIQPLQELVNLDPRHAVGHALLGAALFNVGRYSEGEREFRRALELKATCSDAQANLGALLRLKGELAASETALRRAVKQAPNNPDFLESLGQTLTARSQLRDAKGAFERALRLKPRHAGALCGLGRIAASEGRFADAEALYRRALDAEPGMVTALAGLAELRRATVADKDWLTAAERALAAGIPPSHEAGLRFAMGKYFDDLQNYPRAFEHYRRANELCKSLVPPYNRAARTSYVDEVTRVYSREALTGTVGSASEKPLFVTGMPRSGTTLVDQILASHPQIASAGELEFWHEAARKHDDIVRHQLPDPSLRRKLADSCLTNLARHAPDALRVIDKSNFSLDYLGLIHAVFPKARIIYVRRDPLDTCLSCYFQHFANAAHFTMDLSDLAHYYREHDRLLKHWRVVLPPEVFLEVNYADLVADQEAWSRRIVEFVGVEWDPRCLEFHKTGRAVVTASSWQVRQRIYSSSIGRWKNYEKFIGPLLKLRDLAI